MQRCFPLLRSVRLSGVCNSGEAFRVMEDDCFDVEKNFEPPGDEKYRRAAHAMFFARWEKNVACVEICLT